MEGEASGRMVCIPRTAEVLVAVTQEMAEGLMDCPAGTLARYAYFIAHKQAKGFCTRCPDTDSFDYSFDGASEFICLTLNDTVLYDNKHSNHTSIDRASLLPKKNSSESII